MEKSELKAVLGEIETLRMKRQRELLDRPHPSLKRFTQQELNDEACPTYKNLLVGRSNRLPDRQTIINIADYLECTSNERNDLLMAARYLPIQSVWEGRGMKLALEWAQETLRAIPFPAMIVTHTQDIKGFNESFGRLFDIPLDHFHEHLMNRVDFHFNLDLPIRSRSTFDKASLEQWESHAISGIQAFKREHLLSRHDAWYQKVVHRAEKYIEVAKYENKPSNDEEIDRTQIVLAKQENSNELVPIRYKQITISTSGHAYPHIVVFLPVDAAARNVFASLGCPSQCNFGLPS